MGLLAVLVLSGYFPCARGHAQDFAETVRVPHANGAQLVHLLSLDFSGWHPWAGVAFFRSHHERASVGDLLTRSVHHVQKPKADSDEGLAEEKPVNEGVLGPIVLGAFVVFALWDFANDIRTLANLMTNAGPLDAPAAHEKADSSGYGTAPPAMMAPVPEGGSAMVGTDAASSAAHGAALVPPIPASQAMAVTHPSRTTPRTPRTPRGATPRTPKSAREQEWSTGPLFALTSWRLYSGFLNATWLPFLMAMEGATMMQEKQSLFMGMAKLTYGVTIMLNPVLGLMGDKAVLLRRDLGRRMFFRFGVCMAAGGIFGCLVAHRHLSVGGFLFGILVWRLGDAVCEVTAEALVPEVVPFTQLQSASSIKSGLFLLGGLLGYLSLVLLAKWDYIWLLYGYPALMLLCSIPTLVLLESFGFPSEVEETPRKRLKDASQFLAKAYLGPMRLKGGFPLASVAILIFSLGTAPLFLFLLIVRDIVGTLDYAQLEIQFCAASTLFQLCSAISGSASSALAAGIEKDTMQLATAGVTPVVVQELLKRRGRVLVAMMVLLGMVSTCLPALAVLPTHFLRVVAFLGIAAVLGAVYGAAFARWQDLVWRLVPPGEEKMANAMGFQIMCRLLGLGFSNLIAGVILANFATLEDEVPISKEGWLVDADGQVLPVYSVQGYCVLCVWSLLCALCSSYFAYSAVDAATSEIEALTAKREAQKPVTPSA